MEIIEVIPLTNLPPQVPQILSYFFDRPLVKGSVVEILMNNRKINGVVASSLPVESQKMVLKGSNFQLKKISTVINETSLVSDDRFKLALWLSKNYFAPLGLCLKTVLPPFFLKKEFVFYPVKNKKQEGIKPMILLSRTKDLIKNIEPEMKKKLKDKKQVLIIVPEIFIAETIYQYFSGDYKTEILHSKIPAGRTYAAWNKIASGEVQLIIGTRQALFANFLDLGLIIMEDPSNEAYKSEMSPKYNTKELVFKISEINSAEIIFISQIPDIVNYFLSKNGTSDLKDKRSPFKSELKVEDMVQEIKSGNFSVFSRELAGAIELKLKEDKKILIFSGRRGYASYLLCQNCGFHFKCPQCAVPLKVHVLPDKSLICRRCSSSYKFPDSCPNCHSYKLKAAGFAGSEKIKEFLEDIIQRTGSQKKVVVFDADSDKNLLENQPEICIATQAIFSHRFELSFDLIGIQSIDSLMSIPDFKAEEQLMIQFQKLLDFEPATVIAQTYEPASGILNFIGSGNYQGFYDQELGIRKTFGYPPFVRLIKLSYLSYDKNKGAYEARILSEKLKMAINQKKAEDKVKLIGPSPAFIEKEKNRYINNIILKISPEQRPDEINRFVPSDWSIDVDPRSIL